MNSCGILSCWNRPFMIYFLTQAIKEDIIRSLYSRLTMHCNSLMEDLSTTSAEGRLLRYCFNRWLDFRVIFLITLLESKIIHEPPRRVSVYLPHTKVRFTDYLFPGEDGLSTLPAREQLDIQTCDDQQILYESLEVETGKVRFFYKIFHLVE